MSLGFLALIATHASGATPRLLEAIRLDAFTDKSAPALMDGDTLRFQTNWVEAPTGFTADFSDLDGNRGQTTIVSMGVQGIQTRWLVTHIIPLDNSRGDGIRIPVHLEASKFVTEDSLDVGTATLLVCLANEPVVERETTLLSHPGPRGFAPGDSIKIETRWTGGNGLPLHVSADFRPLSAGYSAKDHLVAVPESGTARISYRLPVTVVPTSATTVTIPVRCYYEADCVVGESRVIRVLVDPVRPQLLSVERVTVPAGQNPPLANGDTLMIETTWNTATEQIAADFTALDAATGETTITPGAAAHTWIIEHVLPLENPVTDASDIAIPITGFTSGHADTVETDNRFRVCLSNGSPVPLYTRLLDPPPRGYGAGDTVEIEAHWISPSGLAVGFGAGLETIDATYDDSKLHATERADGSQVLSYTLSPRRGDIAPTGSHPLIVRCSDSGCGIDSVSLEVRIDTEVPQLLDFARLDTLPDGTAPSLRTGDRLRLWTRWSPGTYRVTADFTNLDGNATPSTVEIQSDSAFLVTHAVGSLPGGIDRDSIRVILTGFWRNHADSAGVDSSIMVCLSNTPPVPLWTHLEHPPAAGYGLDAPNHDITIRTRWSLGPGLRARQYYADFGTLVESFDPDAQIVVENDDGSVSITFRPNEQQGGTPRWGPVARELRRVPIPVYCLDDACGVGRSDSVLVDWDGIRPVVPVVLDALPPSTSRQTIEVGGTAAGAAFVAVSVSTNRSLISRVFVPVDSSTGRFDTLVSLRADATNDILARSADRVQNADLTSAPATFSLVQVTTGLLEISKPFRPGRRDNNQIRLSDPLGVSEAEILLFDLAGACVARWPVTGTSVAVSLDWDGLDAAGRRAAQGMYLVRATWTQPASGRKRSVTTPLYLME